MGLNKVKLSTWLVQWRSSTTTIIVIDASTLVGVLWKIVDGTETYPEGDTQDFKW